MKKFSNTAVTNKERIIKGLDSQSPIASAACVTIDGGLSTLSP